MGYANALPYSFLKFPQNGTYADSIIITNLPVDTDLGQIITPEYNQPLSHCYADFSCMSRRDSSAAANYLTDTNLGEIYFDDGVNPEFTIGLVPKYTFYCPSNGTQNGDIVNLRTDFVSNLRPNTTYQITFKNATALGNNLYIYVPRITLNLYFGMG